MLCSSLTCTVHYRGWRLWWDIVKLFMIHSFFSVDSTNDWNCTLIPHHLLTSHRWLCSCFEGSWQRCLTAPAWFRGNTENEGNWIFFLMCRNISSDSLKKKKSCRLNWNAITRQKLHNTIRLSHLFIFSLLLSHLFTCNRPTSRLVTCMQWRVPGT